MNAWQRRPTELSGEQSLRLLGSVPASRIVFTEHAMPAIRLVNHRQRYASRRTWPLG
jgi:hypothetical protein